MSTYKEIVRQGLWLNNPGLVQLLGLCPLLAVTTSLTSALGLGLATMLVLFSTNTVVSLVRNFVPNEIRIPIFVMVIASVVTVIELLMHAFLYDLYQALGIFIPLIVTNCIVIGRAEAYASKNSVGPAAFDGFMMGSGFALVLCALGALRELIGAGTLFSGAELLLGDWAKVLTVQLFEAENPMLLAILPPGAFLVMGLLIAGKNYLDARAKAKTTPSEQKITRARVTHVTM